jgi:hypothetical protein
MAAIFHFGRRGETYRKHRILLLSRVTVAHHRGAHADAPATPPRTGTREDAVETLAACRRKGGQPESPCGEETPAIIVTEPSPDLLSAVRGLPDGPDIAGKVESGAANLLIAALRLETSVPESPFSLPESYWRYLIER